MIPTLFWWQILWTPCLPLFAVSSFLHTRVITFVFLQFPDIFQYDMDWLKRQFVLEHFDFWEANTPSPSSVASVAQTQGIIMSWCIICFYLLATTVFLLIFFNFFWFLFPCFSFPGSMAMSPGVSTSSGSGGSPYASFCLDLYLQDYKDYMNIERLKTMPCKKGLGTVCDERNYIDWNTVLVA